MNYGNPFHPLPIPRPHALSRAIRATLRQRRAAFWAGGLLAAGLSLAAPAQTVELSDLDGSNGLVLNGINVNDLSGGSVSSAGDVNGDGVDDLIIGANNANPNGVASGASYVVFGSSSGFAAGLELSALDGSNGFALNGIDAYDFAGSSVSGAGDVNGDGVDDLIVGAFGADPNGKGLAGESYVVFGTSGGFAASLNLSSLDGTNGFVINGVGGTDQSGRSVSGAGDVNGDGFDDVIIGAPFAFSSISTLGESYVVFGASGGFAASLELSSLDGTNGFVINAVGFDFAGRSVSGAGDVNGDGVDDVIIGARNATPNGINSAGQSYVVFGASGGFAASLNLSSLDGTNGFVLNGIDADDQSGGSVSGAGDVNGDGVDDVIVGAFTADPSGDDSGESYVVFGASGGFAASLELSALDGTNGFVLNGIDAGDFSGISVSGAGDVNGDGVDDVIVGAFTADPNGDRSGEGYVVFGASGGFAASLELSALDGTNGFVLNGIDTGDNSGSSVSGAGDVNGDGVDDLIISAASADPGGRSEAGESYVVFGVSANSLPTADAGPDQMILAGQTVQLDGSGSSDLETETVDLTYAWSFLAMPAGSMSDFDDAASPMPSFMADSLGTYEVQLTVIDEGGLSDSDQVTLTSENVPPNAEAGPDLTTMVGDTVMLDGSASSDPEGALLIFSWTLLSQPPGSTALLLDALTLTPSLTPDVIGAYEIELVVDDGFASSTPDLVTVTAISAEDFAQAALANTNGIITSLPVASFDKPQSQDKINNEITKAIDKIQSGQNDSAVHFVDKMIERVDGCALRGAPDAGPGPNKEDWVMNCPDQQPVYDALIGARDALVSP